MNKVEEMMTLFAFYSLSLPAPPSPHWGRRLVAVQTQQKNSASQNFIMFYHCGLLTFKKLKYSWHTMLY